MRKRRRRPAEAPCRVKVGGFTVEGVVFPRVREVRERVRALAFAAYLGEGRKARPEDYYVPDFFVRRPRLEPLFRYYGNATRFFLEAGADVKEDFLYLTVAFRNGFEEYGFRFVKRLFNVSLEADESGGRLCYFLRPGTSLVRVEVLPAPLFGRAEADLEKEEFPTAFWDRLWWMVRSRGLREALFSPVFSKDSGLDFSWKLWQEAKEEHRRNPRRETLLLQRSLFELVLREGARLRELRRKHNASRRRAYEELLRLTDRTPHSLNLLRQACPGAAVRRIAFDYWRVDVVVDGEELTGWGVNPVDAAEEALGRVAQLKSMKVR